MYSLYKLKPSNMATKKRRNNRAKSFKSLLRKLREAKFPKLSEFAKKIAEITKQSEKAAISMISRYETLQNGGQPSHEFMVAAQQVLNLSDNDIKALKRSFARSSGSKKAAKKKTRSRKNSKKAQQPQPSQKQKPATVKAALVTPGTVTPEIAEQFAAAVKGANGMSLELAQKLLEEKVGS